MKIIALLFILLICCSGCASIQVQDNNPTSNPITYEDSSNSTSSDAILDHESSLITKEDIKAFATTTEAISQVEFYAQYANFEEFSNGQELAEKTNLGVLIWIAPELYDEVGENALIENGNFFEVPTDVANKYLSKYFGIENYDPNIYPNYSSDTKCFNIPTAYGGPSFKVCHIEVHSIEDRLITYKCIFYKSISDSEPKYQSSFITTELLPEEYPFLRLVSISNISSDFDSLEEAIR